MKVGIAGLGLIGGSLAKAYKRRPDITVYGWNRNPQVTGIAKISGAIDGELNAGNIGDCDLILVALYPEVTVKYLEDIAPMVQKSAVVMDCCGTKAKVCEAGFRLAEDYGFTFVGGHPMAGTHRSGFGASTATLFDGACMVVVPKTYDDIRLLDRIKSLVLPAGFGSVSVTTAEKHDEIIAFTSQLAHVVSNAYIKSPTAGRHKGFSAGSYKDLTRVAWLDPDMWTALFLENRENLLSELDILIASLGKYREALAEGDGTELRRLLDEGRRRKEEIDG
jgi:prephenate dehydrogenase